MIGKETAVNSSSILPMPSSDKLNLLPIIGNHGASNETWLALLLNTAMSATASVATELNKAHVFTDRASLIKKATMPVKTGINTNKTVIIFIQFPCTPSR